MDAIHTTGLCKVYGSNSAVDHLDISIPQGSIYGFIGRNGAGKSTTQKLVCGLIKPSSGEIQLFGKPVTDSTTREKVGILIEQAGLYPELSAYENLMLYGLSIGLHDTSKKVKETLVTMGLEHTGKKPTKQFSMGMKQRLGIGMALLGNPELLVLDEPINGLDPEGIREIRQILLQLNQEKGLTIFISSHILGELSKISTHYGIINYGKLVMQISAADLTNNCRDYLHIKVNKPEEAAELLRNRLDAKCEIGSDQELRLYNVTDSSNITKILGTAGIDISELYLHQQDLEEYFLELMGGEK